MDVETKGSLFPLEQFTDRLVNTPRIWLFMDYDGTLADFAPSPDIVTPDPDLIDLLSRLEQTPCIRIAIISGRRLDQIRSLVPVPGIMLAGTYGIELQEMQGRTIQRVEYDAVRPFLERVKQQFEEILTGRKGFFLEDKGWALAIHARYAEKSEADEVLAAAKTVTRRTASDQLFHLLDGERFFEISSKFGDKAQTVSYLIERDPWPGASLVYVGDDDKDEDAFAVIKSMGGDAVVVSRLPRETRAGYRIESPEAVRSWLEHLQKRMAGRDPYPC